MQIAGFCVLVLKILIPYVLLHLFQVPCELHQSYVLFQKPPKLLKCVNVRTLVFPHEHWTPFGERMSLFWQTLQVYLWKRLPVESGWRTIIPIYDLFLFAVAAVVANSRITDFKHFPVDVLAGACAWWGFWDRWRRNRGKLCERQYTLNFLIPACISENLRNVIVVEYSALRIFLVSYTIEWLLLFCKRWTPQEEHHFR